MKSTSNKIVIATLAIMATTIPLAQASPNNVPAYTDYTDGFFVNAEVISTEPIFKYVTTNVPRQNCYQQRVTHTRYSNADRGGSVLLGGIIGGVIGNNLGHGKSRKGRALIGALIGSQIGSRIADQNAYSTQYTNYEPRCQTQYVSESQRRIAGYNVSYRYRGQIMTTQMPYRPGKWIKLSINASPVID